jgi:NAD(P)-dependent dehydrogenase (short-subunit alcohol dehydrogenase family)
MHTLQNRIALVTGSSRGIGRQIALGLAKRRCNVVIHGRTLDHLTATETLLAGLGVRIFKIDGDLGTDAGIESVVRGVAAGPGHIDILYNNAGISSGWTPILETPISTWIETLRVNLFSAIAVCNAFVPGMKKHGFGRVINLTSGIRETPHLAPYSVSKAAIDRFTEELAVDCRGSGVLVNGLAPGWLKTDLGGPDAMFPVETVLPGALVPALLGDDGPSGIIFNAQDYKNREDI